MIRKSRKLRRHFSFAFLLAIPTTIGLGSALAIVNALLLTRYPFAKDIWSIFACGFIGALCIHISTSTPRLETLIHELRHAVVVILSGNRLTDFRVERGTGHVRYCMYVGRVHFAPFIVLAPYFFPLLSLPVLAACIFLETDYRIIMTFVLGVALGTDIGCAIEEFHPYQTDLRKIFGGFFSIGLFLIGFHLFWINLALTWVIAESRGYLFAVYRIVNFFTERLPLLYGQLYTMV